MPNFQMNYVCWCLAISSLECRKFGNRKGTCQVTCIRLIMFLASSQIMFSLTRHVEVPRILGKSPCFCAIAGVCKHAKGRSCLRGFRVWLLSLYKYTSTKPSCPDTELATLNPR